MTDTAAHELSVEQRSALVDLLYRLADDDLVLGHRCSEWTGLGPILEADIAFSSMAQDLMGHAWTLYNLLHELGEANPDAIAFARSLEQYRCCSMVSLANGDWAFSTIRQFLYAEAKQVRLTALADSTYAPLAEVARKLRGEVKYHTMHGRMWVTRLGAGTNESHTRLHEALQELYPHALGMFEPTKCDAAIAAEQIGPSEVSLLEQWRTAIQPTLNEAGLPVPKTAEPLYGGRIGRHPAELARLLQDMHKVFRLDPAAVW
ncbi:MAG: 1,2-phenylacetyl-CoA epoxidase subunit PaaC [Phycisphaerae bacterium]